MPGYLLFSSSVETQHFSLQILLILVRFTGSQICMGTVPQFGDRDMESGAVRRTCKHSVCFCVALCSSQETMYLSENTPVLQHVLKHGIHE